MSFSSLSFYLPAFRFAMKKNMFSRGSTLVKYEVFCPCNLFLGHLKLLYDLSIQGLEGSF